MWKQLAKEAEAVRREPGLSAWDLFLHRIPKAEPELLAMRDLGVSWNFPPRFDDRHEVVKGSAF
jgi:hypothetical protein